MRTPAQQTASRANGARSRGPKTPDGKLRSTAKPFLHDQLVKATVVKKESAEGFQELVHHYMLRFAPRDPVEQAAVEEICSATWRLYRLRAIERKALDLECVLHACGALAGRNRHVLHQHHETRLQNIIRRSLARLRALRQVDEKKEFDQNAPEWHSSGAPAGGPHRAPEP